MNLTPRDLRAPTFPGKSKIERTGGMPRERNVKGRSTDRLLVT
jgi:hypothetical protein